MWFTPDQVIFICFGMSKFGAVLEKDKKTNGPRYLLNGKTHLKVPVQREVDIPQAKKDCEKLKKCLQHYKLVSHENLYDLSNDPSYKEVEQTFRSVGKKIISGNGKEAKPFVK